MHLSCFRRESLILDSLVGWSLLGDGSGCPGTVSRPSAMVLTAPPGVNSPTIGFVWAAHHKDLPVLVS